MALAPQKQDSNLVGFFKTRETDLGVVPLTATWATREPNSFDDLGGEYTQVARKPFSPSRQRKKGSTTDLDADGGFNEDLTQDNMQTEMEEFFFAALRKTPEVLTAAAFAKVFTVVAATDIATVAGGHGLINGAGPFQVTAATTIPAGLTAATNYWAIVLTPTTFKFATTRALALAGTPVDVTNSGTGALTITSTAQVSTTDDSFTVNFVPAGVQNGSIVVTKGYAASANNGIKNVTAVTASKVSVSQNLDDEANPPAGAQIKVVGHTFAAADLTMNALESSPGVISGFQLIATAGSFLAYNLVPGAWVFIGGDAPNSYFVVGTDRLGGYARIAVNGVSADGKTVTFDKSTFTPADNAGTGKSVAIYFGDVIKNEEDPDLIVRFSSVIERTLGRDADGMQSEFLAGSVANEMTWNSPLANLVNVDLGYIAQRADTRAGAVGPLTRRADNVVSRALGQDAFNTSSNIYRIRMGVIDPLTLNPTALFARVTEWTMKIANNVTASKAQGVMGGFDVTVGNFDVDGEYTAYFSDVRAIHAVKCNQDVTFDAIYAKQNAGIYMDIPLIGLGGGRLDITQDAAIMLPLTAPAAESPFGHTALIGWFSYLPNAAMPDIDC